MLVLGAWLVEPASLPLASHAQSLAQFGALEADLSPFADLSELPGYEQ